MADLNQPAFPGPNDIRDAMLRTIRAGLIAQGVSNPNISKGSDWYIWASAVANEISVGIANGVIALDRMLPDTATGDYLDRIGAVVGLTRQSAAGATGSLVFDTTISPTLISGGTSGAQLIDTLGQNFRVSTSGAYSDGDPIPIEGVATGAATNHQAGDVFTWVSPPAGASATLIVGPSGLTGGVDDESDAAFRTRIQDRMRNPPAGGNWSQVAEWAETIASVQKAFVYPGLNGPATLGVAIVGELVAASPGVLTRTLSAATLADVVNYVTAQLPQHPDLTVKVAADELVDVALLMSLPSATTASPPGPGGGWSDASPWPTLAGTANRVYVSAVTSATSFVLTSNDAATTPDPAGIVDGVTQIAWVDLTNFDTDGAVVRTSTVLTHAGGVGAVTVNLDPAAPFTGIAAGDFISPAAEHLDAYVSAWFTAMGAFGPGQWTADANRLPRAQRYPLTSVSWASDLTASALRAVENAGDEVLDVAWSYRSKSSPTVPALTTTAPNVLVAREFGVYPQ